MGAFIYRQCTCIHKEVYDNRDRMGTDCQAVLNSSQRAHFSQMYDVFFTLVLKATNLDNSSRVSRNST